MAEELEEASEVRKRLDTAKSSVEVDNKDSFIKFLKSKIAHAEKAQKDRFKIYFNEEFEPGICVDCFPVNKIKELLEPKGYSVSIKKRGSKNLFLIVGIE